MTDIMNWSIVDSPGDGTLDGIADKINISGMCSVDTETTGLSHDDYPTGISLAWRVDDGDYDMYVNRRMFANGDDVPLYNAMYIPLQHGDINHYDAQYELIALRMFFEAIVDVKMVMHNSVFDVRMLSSIGIPINWGNVIDSRVTTYCAAGHTDSLALDSLAKDVFSLETTELKKIFSLAGMSATVNNWNTSLLSIADIAHYAAKDAVVTLALAEVFPPEGEICRLEHGILPIMEKLNTTGFPVSVGVMASVGKEAMHWERAAENRIKGILSKKGLSVDNVNGKEFKRVLAIMGIRLAKTDKGAPSLSSDVVDDIIRRGRDIDGILVNFRTYKTCSTLISAIKANIRAIRDNRLHSNWNPLGAKKTGRFSSSNRNLQQISRTKTIDTPDGASARLSIKKAFVAEKDHYFMQGDFSQIELVLMLYIAGHADAVDSYCEGTDLHSLTASSMFDAPMEEIIAEDALGSGNSRRQQAKTINFLIGYGGGPGKMASQTGMPLSEAKELFNLWHGTYPRIRPLSMRFKDELEANGCIETLFGRIQKVYPSDEVNLYTRGLSKVIQGTAADVHKIALINTVNACEDQNMELLAQIHDNQIWHVHDSLDRELAESLLREGMTTEHFPGNFPVIRVDVSTGLTWDELS